MLKLLLICQDAVVLKRFQPKVPLTACMAQLYASPTDDQEVAGSTPTWLATLFGGDWSWKIYITVIILSLQLIQDG